MRKRLCIYLIYDSENVIDRYIAYMLKELKSCCTYLLAVCNSRSAWKGEQMISPYADRIVYRDNRGFDAGGFKDAICSYIGWDNLYHYEELILANDSFYGPFISMKLIFDEMDGRVCDFWGLTKHADRETCDEIVREHIQSYFLAVRRNMFRSKEFRQYWEHMPYFDRFEDVVTKHEMVFTSCFHASGFAYQCLADLSANDSDINNSNNYMQYGYLQYELIAKRNFPFLKKKPVIFDMLDMQTQENLKLALTYIEQNTEYDTDLIWENLIRSFDLSELQRKFHLGYVIPCKETGDHCRFADAAIIVFAEHLQAAEIVLAYLDRLFGSLSIKIYTHHPKIADCYRKSGYRCIVLQDADQRELIREEWSRYRYLCLLHDCDVSSDDKPSCTGKSYFYLSWHNLLCGVTYVEHVIQCFEKEKRLGLLTPPAPNFAGYFCRISNDWEDYYEEVEAYIRRNRISCRLSKEQRLFSYSENIWIRGKILESMPKELPDRNCLRYIWPYIAQSQGYYTGIVQSDQYASLQTVNLQYYLNRMIGQTERFYGRADSFSDIEKLIFKGVLAEFCNTHSIIYVYGTGRKAMEYRSTISRIEAYVVSDGQPRRKMQDGKRVLFLSEIKNTEDTGIVVCLDEKNQKQIIPLLSAGNFQYICI